MSAPALVRYHDGTGFRVALAFEGRTRVHIVVMDGSVRHEALPKTELRHMTPIAGSITAAARKMRGAGARLGISKGARRLLRGLK